jgi:hypothetical protein
MQGEGISKQQLHPNPKPIGPFHCLAVSCARLWGRPTRHNGGGVGQVCQDETQHYLHLGSFTIESLHASNG